MTSPECLSLTMRGSVSERMLLVAPAHECLHWPLLSFVFASAPAFSGVAGFICPPLDQPTASGLLAVDRTTAPAPAAQGPARPAGINCMHAVLIDAGVTYMKRRFLHMTDSDVISHAAAQRCGDSSA